MMDGCQDCDECARCGTNNLEIIRDLQRELRASKNDAERYWLALSLIKNHGSHDQAVLREIARDELAGAGTP